MLCGIVESHRVKCQQYWPESGCQSYGPISVKRLHQEKLPSHVIRKFEVSVSAGSMHETLLLLEHSDKGGQMESAVVFAVLLWVASHTTCVYNSTGVI